MPKHDGVVKYYHQNISDDYYLLSFLLSFGAITTFKYMELLRIVCFIIEIFEDICS